MDTFSIELSLKQKPIVYVSCTSISKMIPNQNLQSKLYILTLVRLVGPWNMIESLRHSHNRRCQPLAQ